MKRSKTLLPVAAVLGFAVSGQGQVLVNDTWIDGTRTDPASSAYSEHGFDADGDGNLESAWYHGGAGSLDPLGPGGPLRGDLGAGGTSSGSWTTHFTSAGAPVTLGSAGDILRVTWQFTLSGVAAPNTSQNFRLALVDTPSSILLSSDGAPADGAYAGYAMLMNMGTTLGNSNPFQLRERSVASGNLLSSAGNWTALGNGATSGNTGYADGVLYTFVMELTRNGSGGLDILSTMSGGSLNNTGIASVSHTDSTPNTFSYNTFAIRPSSATGTAQIFDTSLFKVEFIPVPEPSTAALAGLGLLGMAMARRRR